MCKGVLFKLPLVAGLYLFMMRDAVLSGEVLVLVLVEQEDNINIINRTGIYFIWSEVDSFV